jgi:tetratricopeptide (TPR) repeat protein
MGYVLLKLGRYDEALTLLRLTKDRGKEVLGANHKEVLKSKHLLAEALMAKGELEEASSMLSICLAARNRTLGAVDEDTLDTCRSMATLYNMQGSIEMAESTYLDCLLKAEKHLGPKHRVTLKCNLKYAEMILNELHQPDRAMAMLERCVKGFEETVGLKNVNAKRAVELLEKARSVCGPDGGALPLAVEDTRKASEVSSTL